MEDSNKTETTLNTTTTDAAEAPATEAAPAEAQPAERQAESATADTEPLPAGEKEAEATKPWKTEQNARFAEQRRRREAEETAFRALVGDITNPETGKPFTDRREWEGWKRKAELAAQAKAAAVPPETYEKIIQRAKEEIKRSDPEIRAQAEQLEQYRQREREAVFANDLKAIRKAYPDEKAKSIDELGPQFVAMCASGVSPLAAYEALRVEKARNTKQPPSMGDVKPSGGKGKEYYSREEVAAMNQAEVSKNYETIRKSMAKW